MAILFREYELLAKSGAFDAEYYLGANPDIAALNIDPLLHYVEQGAQQGRGPRADFDVAYYLEQCRLRGEQPSNPLLHFVTIGARQGMKTRLTGDSAVVSDVAALNAATALAPSLNDAMLIDEHILALGIEGLSIDTMSDDSRQLTLRGWALADEPIVQISLTLDEEVLGYAVYGLFRPDIAAAHPQHLKADHCGYRLRVDALPPRLAGSVDLSLTVELANGKRSRRPFTVDTATLQITRTTTARERIAPAARRDWTAPPLRLEVDELDVNSLGVLETSGWAVCFLDIAAIRILVGDVFVGLAEYGHVRDDVASVCPEYPRSRQSGFHFRAPIAHVGAGRHVAKIQALTQSGAMRDVLFPVVIPETSAKPLDAQAFHFHCDEVTLTTRGRVAVSGWAVGGAPMESIGVRIDSDDIGLAEIDIVRPDVGTIFNHLPHARRGGFAFRQALGLALQPGEHILTLTLKDRSGAQREIPLPIQALESSESDAAHATLAAMGGDPDLAISLDLPKVLNGVAEEPITGSLSIGGWTLARAGVKAIDIAVDGAPISTAHHGVRREDVAAVFPGRSDALMSGFAALIPNWSLPKGAHRMSITVLDAQNRSDSVEFDIQVNEAPQGEGPWSLRRKMAQAEVDLQMRVLAGLHCKPSFRFLLKMRDNPDGIIKARKTLASLRDQVYPDWRATVIVGNRSDVPAGLRKALVADLDGFSNQVRMFTGKRSSRLVDMAGTVAENQDLQQAQPLFLSAVDAGDVLGCDALLEWAVASGMNPDADFLYGDERRMSPVTKSVDAYFKPGWSPDLLLSTNYIGRTWVGKSTVIERMGMTVSEWLEQGDFELVLRSTEKAKSVIHVPHVLCARDDSAADSAYAEKEALRRALQRRGVKAHVKKGCVAGVYRIKRQKVTRGLVSIIIPTCASAGRVKACLTTLKEKTAFQNFEIICIENIPANKSEWKIWLRENADQVIETFEPFNWSRYNNLCAARASGEFLLFLNDDVEIIEPNWLDTLLEQAERPEVGVAGPQLLYGDGSVQHAGLVLTEIGKARHVFRHAKPDDPGYFGLALTERNVIGVTGACLLTRRVVFDAVGGFDEAHTIVNNDVDYCLKTWRAGYLNIYTPHAQLIHHELASRGEMGDDYDSSAFVGEWRDVFLKGDPYLNPNLSRNFDDLSPEREPIKIICAGHPLMARETVKRLLVLKLDHIGDCLTALPALRRLKHLFPQARITVLAHRATQSIWAMEAAVDEMLEFDFFHARSGSGRKELADKDLLELGQRLEPLRFDLAVDLRKSPETRGVLKYTGARFLAGFDFQGQYPWLDVALQWEGDTRYTAKRAHVADDLLNLVEAIGTSCTAERSALRPDVEMRLSLPEDEYRSIFGKPVVCVHPAAGSAMRQWPPEYFAETIDLLQSHLDVHVAIIGGPDEMEIANKVLDAVRQRESVYCLVGKSILAELPTLIAKCALFIGNNSGPKHIAAALGVPTIGVHSGVVDSNEWGPLGDNAVAIRRDMSCSPCYLEKPDDCPKKLACLRGLGPSAVYTLAARMLVLRCSTAKRQVSQLPKFCEQLVNSTAY